MSNPGRWMVATATASVLLIGAFGVASAQVQIESSAVTIELTGRVHTQFNTTSADGAITSELLIRRARLTAEIEVNDFVSGKVQPDFGEGDISLKDAYVRLTFDPALRATIGQFKRPFDLFELTSSTRILVVERAGGVRGVSSCQGPGGLCSFSRFTEKLEYADRDIGLLIDGTDRTGRFTYMAAVTNGAGANNSDENDSKSFSGRIEYAPVPDLTIAGNLSAHDYVNPVAGADDHALAYGGDVEWGNFDQGFHIQTGVVAGDNWANLVDGDPTTFLTAQAIVTYRHPIQGNRFVNAVEPVGRVSWGDPNTDLDGGAGVDADGLLLTPGFVVHFVGRNKIGVNVDIWSPAEGDSEVSLKIQSYLHF